MHKKILMDYLDCYSSWCKVHFADSELKVARASKQYVYDDLGNEYLDCVSSAAHGKCIC